METIPADNTLALGTRNQTEELMIDWVKANATYIWENAPAPLVNIHPESWNPAFDAN